MDSGYDLRIRRTRNDSFDGISGQPDDESPIATLPSPVATASTGPETEERVDTRCQGRWRDSESDLQTRRIGNNLVN
jgi:hypothetical protein